MDTITLFFDWHILLLISPCLVGLGIFCYLHWSENHHHNEKYNL